VFKIPQRWAYLLSCFYTITPLLGWGILANQQLIYHSSNVTRGNLAYYPCFDSVEYYFRRWSS